MSEKKKRRRSDPAMGMLLAEMLFFFLGFLQLAIQEAKWESFLLALVVPAIIFAGNAILPRLYPSDRLLLSLTNFLCALSVLVLYRWDAAAGRSQAVSYGVGVGAMILCVLFARYIPQWKRFTPLLILGSFAFLALPAFMGKEINGAKNWISLGGFSAQPSEFVKLPLLLVLSYFLSQRKIVWAILFTGGCLLFLGIQRDLGTAIVYYGVLLCMLYALTGSLTLVGGLAGGSIAALAGVYLIFQSRFHQLFEYVNNRLAIWRDLWKDAPNQITYGLMAVVNGGPFGTGVGLGNAGYNTRTHGGIPYAENDFIFPTIIHEFGMVFGLILLCMYGFIIVRAIMIARRSRTAFHSLLCIGCAALIAIQSFIIIAGNFKLIPLTGVTLPFLSAGGSSMVSSLCVIGFLQGVASRNEAGVHEDRALAMQGGEAE